MLVGRRRASLLGRVEYDIFDQKYLIETVQAYLIEGDSRVKWIIRDMYIDLKLQVSTT